MTLRFALGRAAACLAVFAVAGAGPVAAVPIGALAPPALTAAHPQNPQRPVMQIPPLMHYVPAGTIDYNIRDYGAPPIKQYADNAYPVGLNNTGQIVGFEYLQSGQTKAGFDDCILYTGLSGKKAIIWLDFSPQTTVRSCVPSLGLADLEISGKNGVVNSVGYEYVAATPNNVGYYATLTQTSSTKWTASSVAQYANNPSQLIDVNKSGQAKGTLSTTPPTTS